MSINREISQFANFVEVDDVTQNIGIATGGNFIGIGTRLPSSKFEVIGQSRLNDIESLGVSTFRSSSGIGTVVIGSGSTVFQVEGQASISRSLSIGSSAIVLDSTNNTIRIGDQLILDGNTNTLTVPNINITNNTIGVVASGVGITIKEDGNILGSAYEINFGDNISVDLSSGIATVSVSELINYWDENPFGIHNLSRVGIGTTNPTELLTVRGTASAINLIGSSIDISGISTFRNGSVLIGTSILTGTASQPLQVTGGAYISGNTGIGTTNSSVKLYVDGDAIISGIITATQFSTGSGNIVINNNTISGPAEITIDPAAVGDNTGAVRIRGDLYVDGTQTYINSTTIELADFNVGIATTIATNALLDGAGIDIGSTGIRKRITWNNAAQALSSSEDWNLQSERQYRIGETSVLSSTTLGMGVTNSSLTSVGTLRNLNVSGITTLGSSNGIGTVTIGIGGTALLVQGNARITGILSIGQGTITLDPNENTISIGTGITFNANTGTVSVQGSILGDSSGNANYAGIVTASSAVIGTAVTITSSGINAPTGVITSSQFSTGSGTLGFTTSTISGPETITIDPATVGDNTGTVRIRGDLVVDGNTTTINSITLDVNDKVVGIASAASPDDSTTADQSGIAVYGTTLKTLLYNNATTSWRSNQDFDVDSGRIYRINGTSVLSATTLGTGVVNSSLTSVGTLSNLGVSTTGIGTIPIADITTNLRTTQITEKANVLGTAAGGNYDLGSSGVVYFHTGTGANGTTWTPNFRYNASTNLRSILTAGQSVTVTIISTQPNVVTPPYSNSVQIDGTSSFTYGIQWSGGSAPTFGSASAGGGIDIYTYTLIRTSSNPSDANAWLVLASRTQYD